ncbi:uncharacterized protein LOC123471280 [Daphnia magna]|uniref:uncharacterized protein LOC123471280 n=1 Tax=Daphnia magna TaxID=35525 RepID=UPI001E1BC077|nr:uncharacterized protein LOC123471280 [Daphnia magna]
MPRANKLPKYALFDFNDGSVETGTSSLIDVECDGDETSDRNFPYDVSHFVFWPHRPSKNAEEEEIVKLKQCAKILLFGNDLILLKHYRDQLADEILPVASFGKIREKIWEKTDKPDEKINGQIQIALGSGERQSKRLKEKKYMSEETRDTSKPKTAKQSVVRKTGVKKKHDIQKSEDILKKITEQKALFDNFDEKPSDHTFQEPVKRKRTSECSGDSTATTLLETDGVRSAGRAGSEVNKFISSPKTRKLSSSSVFSPATSDEESSDGPEKKSISNADLSTSAFEVGGWRLRLEALKAEMIQKSCDDIQSLKDKVRYLQEENDNLKCKLKFCEEFTNVRTWIDQLIAKQKANKQLSSSSESSSDVIATVSKIDEPPRNCSEAEAAKLESKIDLENPLFIEAQFPITEKVIDSIPLKIKNPTNALSLLFYVLCIRKNILQHTLWVPTSLVNHQWMKRN